MIAEIKLTEDGQDATVSDFESSCHCEAACSLIRLHSCKCGSSGKTESTWDIALCNIFYIWSGSLPHLREKTSWYLLFDCNFSSSCLTHASSNKQGQKQAVYRPNSICPSGMLQRQEAKEPQKKTKSVTKLEELWTGKLCLWGFRGCVKRNGTIWYISIWICCFRSISHVLFDCLISSIASIGVV